MTLSQKMAGQEKTWNESCRWKETFGGGGSSGDIFQPPLLTNRAREYQWKKENFGFSTLWDPAK